MVAERKPINRTYIGAEYEEVCELPDLIGIQKESYEGFLQSKKLMSGEPLDENCGLEEVFRSIFPIEGPNGEMTLNYESYTLDFDNIKYNEIECKKKGRTYSVPLKAVISLGISANDELREKEIFLGDIPLMTDRGTFVVNGAERVVVSQIHRSPGVIFSYEKVTGSSEKDRSVYSSRIIPYRGSWLEFEIDEKKQVIAAKIDRKKKILGTLFLRAIGINTREKIISAFYKTREAELKNDDEHKGLLEGKYLAKDIFIEIEEGGKKLKKKELQAGSKLLIADIEHLIEIGVDRIEVVDMESEDSLHSNMILNCFEMEEAKYTRPDISDEPTKEDVLTSIYAVLMPGEIITVERGERELNEMFFSQRRYDLGTVGRYKLQKKFHAGEEDTEYNENLTTLTPEDIVNTMRYLIRVYIHEENIDDIDHLGNRRVRSVGELLQQQLKAAFSRMERTAKERMNATQDDQKLSLRPQDLISNKPIVAAIKDFFGSSQFSQFMDQINPLAELTHKRRLTALGNGGLNRDRAGFEVRDVHYTHYGRMCPIETPEGPNIGLIVSLANYTRINKHGFLETPYRKVVDGKVTKEVRYLDANDEEKYFIAQANAKVNKNGTFAEDDIPVRNRGDYTTRRAGDSEIKYMDVSPKQVVSVAASLIPFLEHDDANRALLGSNMQRQAVPLVFPEAPRVGTGMERKTAYDSGVLVKAERAGRVIYVSSTRIEIAQDCLDITELGGEEPVVKFGDKVTKSSNVAKGIKSKGAGTVLHASSQMVVTAPDSEIFVQNIPAKQSDYERTVVVKVGDIVNEKDMIVSDVREKNDRNRTSDRRDIKAKATGYVLAVSPNSVTIGKIDNYRIQKFQRTNNDTCFTQTPIVDYGQYVNAGDVIADGPATDRGDLALGRNILVGFVPWNGYNYEDAVLISERVVKEDIYSSIHIKEFTIDVRETKLGPERLTKDIPNVGDGMTKKLDDEGIVNIGTMVHPGHILVGKVTPKSESDTTPEFKLLNSIFGEKAKEVRDTSLKVPHGTEGIVIDVQRLKKTDSDELPPGVDETIKVLIATKRKLRQGDKMAGRHGNKGVVSRILPEEDMPFMEDGTPLDVCLNPLGVPSRMNIGQLMETQLGWAAVKLDQWYSSPVFQSATMEQIEAKCREAGLPENSKIKLYDGRTGVPFVNPVFCGYIYYLKLHHLVDDKMHARSTGPYSLVTQQPLGGKAQFGGQRLGEMEVWALEAYGAANTLQELLTIKSDDMNGRVKIYESIVKGEPSINAGMPEAFNVLVQEIRGLALDMSVYDSKGKQVALTERDEEIISKKGQN
ncbi:MAG: DNA-directed RNA polymerase subunit beta [Sphaerochaetaceae bacterium]|nr:DNA-directed RNA polymerase subunit beta [Sphaerochaetaceae bacterium]